MVCVVLVSVTKVCRVNILLRIVVTVVELLLVVEHVALSVLETGHVLAVQRLQRVLRTGDYLVLLPEKAWHCACARVVGLHVVVYFVPVLFRQKLGLLKQIRMSKMNG